MKKILIKEKKQVYFKCYKMGSVHKKNNLYIFTKNRSNEKNVLSDDYLKDFIVKYLSK